MRTRLQQLLAATVLVISGAGVTLATPGIASAAPSHVVHASAADRSVLMTTFIKYKLSSHAMKSTDHVKWTKVRSSDPVGPLMAYDGVDHEFWALGNFQLLLPASYAAKVSFQDGGSYGVYYKTLTGHWIMKGYAGIPLCPAIVPAPVAHLWHLVKYGGC